MLAYRSRCLLLATTQGVAGDTALVTSQPDRDDFSAKVLERASLASEEVADFWELDSSPRSQRLAARALAYATVLNGLLDRMAGFTLGCAWLAVTSVASFRRPADRLRLHTVATGGADHHPGQRTAETGQPLTIPGAPFCVPT